MGLLALLTLGAQSAVLRGYVDLRADQLDYVRYWIAAREPGSYDELLVIVAAPEPWRGSTVVTTAGQLRGGWAGQVRSPHHHSRPGRCREALASPGRDRKPVRFAPERPLVIDRGPFVRGRTTAPTRLAGGTAGRRPR